MTEIGFTNGCFDIVHLGHLRYLKAARQMCDVLVVGLNSDKGIKLLKGSNRPINSEGHRKEFLEFLPFIDKVILFDSETPIDLIRTIRPNVIFKGGDYSVDQVVGAEFVKSYGGRVEIIEFFDGFSTTGIIDRARTFLG